MHYSSQSFTSREKAVLDLLCQGLTAKEISQVLHLSPHTVVTHKTNMMEKVGARNAVQMVAIFFKDQFGITHS